MSALDHTVTRKIIASMDHGQAPWLGEALGEPDEHTNPELVCIWGSAHPWDAPMRCHNWRHEYRRHEYRSRDCYNCEAHCANNPANIRFEAAEAGRCMTR